MSQKSWEGIRNSLTYLVGGRKNILKSLSQLHNSFSKTPLSDDIFSFTSSSKSSMMGIGENKKKKFLSSTL